MAHQAYYSLIGRDYEWELMPLALDQKVGAVVWSPLGWGRLTGKIRRGQPLPAGQPPAKQAGDRHGPAGRRRICLSGRRRARRRRQGDRQDRPADRASTGCSSGRRVANVIIGARNEEQLRQNLGAVGWNLTPEQVARLDAASATTPAYPYWHQKGFQERNPAPV